jgi:hypothetical protein
MTKACTPGKIWNAGDGRGRAAAVDGKVGVE